MGCGRGVVDGTGAGEATVACAKFGGLTIIKNLQPENTLATTYSNGCKLNILHQFDKQRQ